MSRTYHHGLKARERKFGKAGLRYGHGIEASPKRKRTTHHMEWMNTPGWWINEIMTRKQRAQTRQLLHRVSKLLDYEEAPLFPLAKKPHIYYW